MGGHRASGAGDDLVDGPVDLAAVRADDALLDALAGGAVGSDRGGYGFADGQDDDRLAAILASWRADIEADPMPELVTLDEAVEAVTAGHEARDRVASRARRRMPFAVAAAAAVVACAGFGIAVHGALPGDSLWGVSKVFFSERAESVEKVEDVRSHIEAANSAITRGDRATALNELRQADVVLPQVAPEQQAPLVADRDRVRGSLDPSPGRSPSNRPSGNAPPPEDRTTPDSPEGTATPSRPPESPPPGSPDSDEPQQQAPPADPAEVSPTPRNGSTSTTTGMSSTSGTGSPTG